jgi:hypothetical protein
LSRRFFVFSRTILIITTLAAALVFFGFSSRGEATMSLPLLEITGTLVRIDDSTVPAVIVLDVDGQVGSAPLAGTCLFRDAQDNIRSREDFLEMYRGKKVTLTLHETSGETLACRAE